MRAAAVRSHLALAAALLAGLLTLAGCGQPGGAGADLFPLAQGRHWTYDMRTEREGDSTERETVTLRNLGADNLDSGPAFHRRSDSGVDYWIRADDTGVYRVASKSDLDPEPQADRSPRYVLKAPYSVGTSWQADTTAYLLQRRQEFPREIKHSHPRIPMTYRIASTGQAVQTPAGQFTGCTTVRGSATLKLFADPVSGWKDLALDTTEWYCPGVGLVKLVREEPAQSAFLTGGRLTMELTEWQ
jgi:hypothetical protein